MKTAVMTDSNSGIKPEEGEKLGVFSLSMPVIIDGKVYFEGKDIEEKEFYDSMISGKDVTSSQPSPGDVMDMWDSILENGLMRWYIYLCPVDLVHHVTQQSSYLRNMTVRCR